MTKEPMTPQGVEDKLAEVYGLSTIDRMAEADAIESDFKAWVGDNFNLEMAQENFLSGLNAVVAGNFGKNCAL